MMLSDCSDWKGRISAGPAHQANQKRLIGSKVAPTMALYSLLVRFERGLFKLEQ